MALYGRKTEIIMIKLTPEQSNLHIFRHTVNVFYYMYDQINLSLTNDQ